MSSMSTDGNATVATKTVAPIETSGNWFWKDGERFLIKGITYEPRNAKLDRRSKESLIDPLSSSWLPELKKDVPYFHKLGINAISISHFDISQDPTEALQFLQRENIYVHLSVFTNINTPHHRSNINDIDLQRLYSPAKVRANLVLVDQTADFPNVLGYSISQSDMYSQPATRLAALHRAAVRDVKLFLQKRGGRPVPVGATVDGQQYRGQALEFMSAGSPSERVDFMAFQVYDWAGPSNFQMSGYRSMVQHLGQFPVPMLFSEYGASFSGRPRPLDEVPCIFSPDMTGVFSGGFLQTYGFTDPATDPGEEADDEEGYDVVRVEEDGSRIEKKDFELYRIALEDVASKTPEEVFGSHEMKDYEGWTGQFANAPRFWWAAPGDLPSFPLEWSQVLS